MLASVHVGSAFAFHTLEASAGATFSHMVSPMQHIFIHKLSSIVGSPAAPLLTTFACTYVLYIYIYICIYIYIRVCTVAFVSVYVYIYICVYTYIHLYVYMYVHIFIQLCVGSHHWHNAVLLTKSPLACPRSGPHTTHALSCISHALFPSLQSILSRASSCPPKRSVSPRR